MSVTGTILVVEDEAKVAHALQEGLQAKGYSVVLAHTGEQAILAATGRGFDLILLDLMLPGCNGSLPLRTAAEPKRSASQETGGCR